MATVIKTVEELKALREINGISLAGTPLLGPVVSVILTFSQKFNDARFRTRRTWETDIPYPDFSLQAKFSLIAC